MNSDRSRIIAEESLGRHDEGESNAGEYVLVTSIRYSKGGLSMISGDRSRRGYYVHCVVEDRDDSGAVGFMLFDGFKAFLEPAERFSSARLRDGQLDAMADTVRYSLRLATLSQREKRLHDALVRMEAMTH